LNSTDERQKRNVRKGGGERSEPPTLLTVDRTSVENTVQPPFIRGRRLQECPRRGYSILTRGTSDRLIIQTRCKQKGCVPCAPAVRAHVSLKAEIGVSIRPHSYFITLTLKKGTEKARDAVFVQKAWRQFCQRMMYKHQWWKETKWMKVVELTKKGQPHLHMIVTGCPGGREAKCKGDRRDKAYVDQGCFNARGSCIYHEVAKAWSRVTEKLGNESWIVDVSKVRSSKKAGLYVSKYVTKGGGDAKRLATLGFKRVWSTSQGFTPDLRIRLRGTVEGKWTKVEFWQPNKDPDAWLKRSDGDRDLDLVGHPLVMAKYESRRRAKQMEFIKDILSYGDSDIQPTAFAKKSASRPGRDDSVRAVADGVKA
jgi:hypothetical protein